MRPDLFLADLEQKPASLRALAYAEAHLPRWRYVPEAALRRWGHG